MNRNKVITLCALAFLAGDWEGVIRSNRFVKTKQRKIEKENELLTLQCKVLMEYVDDVNQNGLEDANTRFNEKVTFINLIRSV